MPAEGFFQRWSRLKSEPELPLADAAGLEPAPQRDVTPLAPAVPSIAQPAPLAPQSGVDGAEPRLPSMDDVAQLHSGSDYSIFVARGVDKSVQRGALKKLFADPHFNIGDGLDLYMGDYNKPDPIPAGMMSALRHTQSFFAQAYPDRKSDEHDPDVPMIASDEADSVLPPADEERPVAGTAVTTVAEAPIAALATTGTATSATSEDNA